MDMQIQSSSYGSYLFYQLNRKTNQYKFITFANTTDTHSAITFPAFMYEAILKTAVKDPEFEFKVRTTPYPLNQQQR